MYYNLASPTELRTAELFAFCSEKQDRSNEGVRRRLADFFVYRKGTSKFLDYTTPVAEGDMSPKLVKGVDYLTSVDGLPIFSTAFVDALGADLSAELQFYPCLVRCRGHELDSFVVAKTLKYLPLIDFERSVFRTSLSGSPILRRPFYREEVADEFFIARDVDHPGRMVCSPRMLDLVKGAKLRVLFDPVDRVDAAWPQDLADRRASGTFLAYSSDGLDGCVCSRPCP